MIIPVLCTAVDFRIIQKVSLLHKLMKVTHVIARAVNMYNTKNMEVTKKHKLIIKC